MKRLATRAWPWWAAAAVIAVLLCLAAVNNGVYEATSPPTVDYYVVLRKLYSVVAFGLIGYVVARARRAAGSIDSPLVVGVTVGAYSAFIEVLQFYIDPPPEGLLSNAIDVACGIAGGYVAAILARPRKTS